MSEYHLQVGQTTVAGQSATAHEYWQVARAAMDHADEPRATDELVGRRISHYHITERLGDGGMGVVYKARDLRLDRLVALKFLTPHLRADEAAMKRFAQEAKAVSALDHPNICAVYDIDKTEEGRLFIAMAYYAGETLEKKIAAGPMPTVDVLTYVEQIAKGLRAAHAAGIVHRDVKPANIIVTDAGNVKLVDFGLAKMESVSLTRTGTTLGTVAYMSPEQASGQAVDHRTDLWSLGVVLYELLTGHRPFRGEYGDAVLYAVIHGEAAPVQSLRPDVPNQLCRVVEKLLQKERSARYQQAEDLLTDLRSIRKESTTRSTAGLTPGWHFPSRRTALAAGGTLILLGLVVLFLFIRWEGTAGSDPTQKKPSVAVLPFVNMSPEADNEYFSDGITEELISTLGKIEELHVPARTSAFVFKGAAIDVREVGARLGVDHVLEGSVRKDGDRLKIAAQLIDVENGFHIWSEIYDREMKDVFEIQEDLARNIANALVGELRADAPFAHSSSPTPGADAYVSYLKGLHFWNQRSPEALLTAEGYFKQAIRDDSTFALAYAGLAHTYVPMVSLGLFSAEQYIEKIKGAAVSALRLDDSLAEAHLALAAYFALVWDWDAAEREQLLAIELNRNYATAFQWYGWLLQVTRRQEENLSARERAHQLDPLSPIISTSYAGAHILSGQFDEAVELCRSALELDPDLWYAYSALGQAYWGQGRITEAVESHERALDLSGGASIVLSELAHSYALADRMQEARRMLQELKSPAPDHALPYFDIALAHMSLGERDEALQWLEKAYIHRTVRLAHILTEPRLDPIRDDPRYHAILNQMGLNRFEHR